eukprot:COSAG05_NODE_18791_length_302_cov_2.527094_1_plen_50_part_01
MCVHTEIYLHKGLCVSDREKDRSFERLQSRMEEVESLLSSGGGRTYDRSS